MSDVRRELPYDLEEMLPGPRLAAALASVDRRSLDERDRIRLLQARHRMVAHVQGELYADLYGIQWGSLPPQENPAVPDEGEEPYLWAETEVALALRWTKFAAGVRLEQARRLAEDLPAVQRSLSDGLIDVPKALLICDEVCSLEPDTARRIVDEVLRKAPELTTGQLRVWLRRLVLAADPAAGERRAKQAVKGRRVAASLNDNQLADLAGCDLAPHRVAAGWERVNAIARAARAAGDPRSMDELRADAMMDLLIGEGIAVGEPITDGGFEPADPEPTTPSAAPSAEPSSGAADSTAGAGQGAASTGQDRAGGDVTKPRLSATMASLVGGDAGKRPDDAGRDVAAGATGSRTGRRRPAGEGGSASPAAPADPSLLDPDADPPDSSDPPDAPDQPDTPGEAAASEPAEPPEDAGPDGDAEHELLRPYWLAGFDHLPVTRPGGRSSRGGGVMPGPRRGVVEMHMSIYTLMGYDDLPAELAGFGPVLADIARQVIKQRPDLAHKYNIYDPDGRLLTRVSTKERPTQLPDGTRRTKRRPTTKVAEFVRARSRTCVRPGCRRHARSCELDHNLAWSEGGESEENNLGPECPSDHHFKHAPGARLIQSSDGGRFGWITPRGMRYIRTADPPLYDDLNIVDP